MSCAAGNRPWQGFFERSGRHVHAAFKNARKVGVLVGNCRALSACIWSYRREAQFLIEEGAGIEAVDQALSDFGMAMGPLATGDLADSMSAGDP